MEVMGFIAFGSAERISKTSSQSEKQSNFHNFITS